MPFLMADRRGFHASGSHQPCAPAIILAAQWAALAARQPALPLLFALRVITRSGSAPASGGPPLGGRAGERAARML